MLDCRSPLPLFRFDKSVKDDILNFLVGSALKLSSYGKVGKSTLFSMLAQFFVGHLYIEVNISLFAISCHLFNCAVLVWRRWSNILCLSFWFVQLRILSLLKGVGSRVILVKDVKLLLTELLKRRQQYHLENDKSCMKLSNIEVEILCLLLEVG